MLGNVSLSALFASRRLDEPLERNRRPRENFAPPLRTAEFRLRRAAIHAAALRNELYVVVASNAAGVTSSPPARLTVWFPPQIEVQPQGQTVVGGGSLTLRVGASGTGPLSYQWRLNSTNLSNGARLSGTTTNTLVISPIVRADAGDYSVIVSNLALAVLSGTARVEVEPLRFQAVRWTTNGQVELRLLGEVGALVKLQTTTNFSQWTTLGTVTNHTGTLDYAFPGTNQPGRYYRAWMP